MNTPDSWETEFDRRVTGTGIGAANTQSIKAFIRETITRECARVEEICAGCSKQTQEAWQEEIEEGRKEGRARVVEEIRECLQDYVCGKHEKLQNLLDSITKGTE